MPRERSVPMEDLPETAVPMARAHHFGGRRVLPRWRSVPMEGLRGTAIPNCPSPPTRGTGSPARAAVGAYEGPPGTPVPNSPGPQTWGDGESSPGGGWCLWRACRERVFPNGPGAPAGRTESPTQAAVGAYGARAGDGSSQWPGPTTWGDGASCPGGGQCLWQACGGRQFATAWAHQLGGRAHPTRQWSVPMEVRRGMPVPNGPGPPAGRMRSLAQAVVGAYGGPAGDRESCPSGGRCPWRACGGGQFPSPLPTGWGDTDCFPCGAWCLWSTCEGRLCAMARAQQLEGRGVLPRRRLVPMERTALKELHSSLPRVAVAVRCRVTIAHYPHAVRQCIAGVPLPTVPRQ